MCWFDPRLLPGDSARRHHRDTGLLPVKRKVCVCVPPPFLPPPQAAGAPLVLLDEVGTGTDPAQGVALAQSLLEARGRDRWSTERPTDRSILLRWSSFVGALWRGRLTASFRGGGARSLASGTLLWRRSHRSEEERTWSWSHRRSDATWSCSSQEESSLGRPLTLVLYRAEFC